MPQSSVEWLVEQLKKRGYAGEFPPHLLFEQAKAMHKEEIKKALSEFPCSNEDAEQYYKENFKFE